MPRCPAGERLPGILPLPGQCAIDAANTGTRQYLCNLQKKRGILATFITMETL
jgi:hypothetical protein